MTRWDRLERYARWRSHRLPLLALPDDVLAHLASHHLDAASLRALAEAVVGWMPSMWATRDVAAVPKPLRASWLLTCVLASVEAQLYALRDFCIFHARDCTTVLVFLDWTPFASSASMPVATTYWESPHCANMRVCQHALQRAVMQSCMLARPVAHVAVHAVLHWHGRTILRAKPLMQTSLPVLPHFAIHG